MNIFKYLGMICIVALAVCGMSAPAFADSVCKSVPVLIDNNLNVLKTACAIPAMNGGVFIDVSMSADCLPTSLAPVNPGEHLENRNRLVDSVTGVVDQSKSC